jgi:hypothetical protein
MTAELRFQMLCKASLAAVHLVGAMETAFGGKFQHSRHQRLHVSFAKILPLFFTLEIDLREGLHADDTFLRCRRAPEELGEDRDTSFDSIESAHDHVAYLERLYRVVIIGIDTHEVEIVSENAAIV